MNLDNIGIDHNRHGWYVYTAPLKSPDSLFLHDSLDWYPHAHYYGSLLEAVATTNKYLRGQVPRQAAEYPG
jgi:hypothetical protein